MGKKTVILLLLILLIAAFFRLWDLKNTPPGLYPDEAMNGNNAREALETGEWRVFYPENNGREGLFINIQALSINFFGNKPWALRLPSAIFGILTVLGTFLLTKELFNKNSGALLAAFLMATSFWHVNFSRIGFRAIMAPFFLVWSFFFLFKLLNKNKNNFQFLSALAGVFYGLGFHSYIAYRTTPLLILIILYFYWFKNKEKEIRKKILFSAFYFLLFTFIAALPLGIYFLNNPADFFGRTSQISVFAAENPLKELGLNIIKTIGMFLWAGDYNWRHNLSGEPMLWWPIGLLFLTGVIISAKKIINKAYKKSFKETTGSPEIFLFAWIILGLFPAIFSGEGMPHALRAIIVLPPVMILIASGANWLLGRSVSKWNKKLTAGLIFIFLAAIAIQSYWQYFYRWAPNINTYHAFSGNYKALGEWLNAQPRDLLKYVIINAEGVKARGWPMPAQTVMFITDTFSSKKQKAKNIIYLLPKEKDKIICPREKKCVIIALEND